MQTHPHLIDLVLALGLGCLVPVAALQGQEPSKAGAIQDNSFLLEEAYNQEAGVVQHINTFTRYRESRDWVYTFTQEWPVPDIKNQLSFTLPYQRMDGSPDGRRAVGDILLNYRYQLLGDGEAKIAVAPRFSLILPTGDERQLRGNGALGYQVNLPVSAVLTDALVTHWNLGATYTPGARNSAGDKADLSVWNFGQSFIWQPKPCLNFMLELAYTSGEEVAGPGLKNRKDSFYISPGLRWAYNFRSGLQIVPGIAVPIGTGPSKGERAVFFYLSFEHPMWKAK